MDAGLVHRDDLARLYVPRKACAHGGQGAALRGEDDAAVRQLPHAQGPEAIGIPQGDELGGGHQHHGISPLQKVHGF